MSIQVCGLAFGVGAASERGGKKIKGVKDCYLRAKARTEALGTGRLRGALDKGGAAGGRVLARRSFVRTKLASWLGTALPAMPVTTWLSRFPSRWGGRLVLGLGLCCFLCAGCRV